MIIRYVITCLERRTSGNPCQAGFLDSLSMMRHPCNSLIFDKLFYFFLIYGFRIVFFYVSNFLGGVS